MKIFQGIHRFYRLLVFITLPLLFLFQNIIFQKLRSELLVEYSSIGIHNTPSVQRKSSYITLVDVIPDDPGSDQLVFLHIPKTGGSSVERAAFFNTDGGLARQKWGYCFYQSCNKDDPGYNSFLYPNPIPFDSYAWHLPPNVLEEQFNQYPNPYISNDVFTIIRNPYDRMVSEYYHSCYNLNDCGDITDRAHDDEYMKYHLNKYLLKHMLQFASAANGYRSNEYYTGKNHFIPQCHFIYKYSSNGKREKDAIPQVMYILRFENLEKEFHDLMRRYSLNITLGDRRLRESIGSINDIGGDGHQKLSPRDFNSTLINLMNQVYKDDFEIGGYDMM